MEDPSYHFDEAHEVEETKRVRISLHLIAKRHLPPESSKWSQEKIVNELNLITHVRLDREKISIIDSFELLGPSVTNLYLQRNMISEIEGLECLTNLKFLTLSGNRIQQISGLAHLKKLTFLDLSENKIHKFDIDELPQSLIILSLKDNPCTQLPDYRGRIVQDMPKLRQLDGIEVTRTERQEAGYVVSDEDDEEEEEESDSDEDEGWRMGKDPPSVKCSQDFTLDINDLFQSTTADILLRSQTRLEHGLRDHRKKMEELNEIRAENNMEPTPRSGRGKTPVTDKPKSAAQMKEASSSQEKPDPLRVSTPRTIGSYTT